MRMESRAGANSSVRAAFATLGKAGREARFLRFGQTDCRTPDPALGNRIRNGEKCKSPPRGEGFQLVCLLRFDRRVLFAGVEDLQDHYRVDPNLVDDDVVGMGYDLPGARHAALTKEIRVL